MARQIIPTDPEEMMSVAWQRCLGAMVRVTAKVGVHLFVGVRDLGVWSFSAPDAQSPAFALAEDLVVAAGAVGPITTPLGPAQAIAWQGASRRVVALVAGSAEVADALLGAVSELCAALAFEGARAEHAELYRAIIGEVGFACDAAMRITAMPASAREFLGLGLDVVAVGRPVSDLVPGWRLSSLEPGETARGYNEALKRIWTCSTMRVGDAGAYWHIIRFRTEDTSSLVQVQQQQFLQALRHDVRSPLTALRGLVSVVLDEPEMPVEERQQLLELLKQEAERVVSFVEDYLVAMALRVSPRPQHARSFDLMAVLVQYFIELQGHARTRGIELRTSLSTSFVESEQSLLQAFARNLVGAFFRMADKGAEISVTLTATTLTVCGAGPGLFQQPLDRPFTTLARSTSSGKRTPGAALGLFLAKKIADTHGWGIAIAQEDGAVTVTVKLS